MNRHDRRSKAAVARKQVGRVTDFPHPGESVVGCVHDPAFEAATYYRIIPDMKFCRPDGTHGSSRWVFLCDDCRKHYGHDVHGCIERGKLRLMVDKPWPKVELVGS
jgi:hypothetical protein